MEKGVATQICSWLTSFAFEQNKVGAVAPIYMCGIIKIMTDKQIFRKKIKSILAALDPTAKGLESASLCWNFLQRADYKEAKIIFGFMPLKDEVDILPILRTAISDGKKVALPRIVSTTETPRGGGAMEFFYINGDPITETEVNKWGIYEPRAAAPKVNIAEICAAYSEKEILILVPGLAFTKDGKRLGRGGGYYDKFLAGMQANTTTGTPRTVGVCYGVQVVESLPCEEHDARVERLLLG